MTKSKSCLQYWHLPYLNWNCYGYSVKSLAPRASVSKRVFVQKISCENKFDLDENETVGGSKHVFTLVSQEKTHFDPEAKSNLEWMAYEANGDTFSIPFRWCIMMFETHTQTISIGAFLVVLRLVVLNQNRETQRNHLMSIFLRTMDNTVTPVWHGL